MVSVVEILDVINDVKSLKLFNTIATKGGNSEDLFQCNSNSLVRNTIQGCHG